MKRGLPALFALTFAAVTVFPAFITLTAVSIPGVSLVPVPVALGLLCAMAALVVYMIGMLLVPPRERPPTLVPLLCWLASAVLSALLGFDPGGGLLFVGIFGMGIIWHLAILRFKRQRGVAPAIF